MCQEVGTREGARNPSCQCSARPNDGQLHHHHTRTPKPRVRQDRSRFEPGIDFDEVHRHVVCVLIACGHIEREHNFVVEAFEVVASAYLPKLAAHGVEVVAAARSFAASGMVVTVKTANERKRYCQQTQTEQALVE